MHGGTMVLSHPPVVVSQFLGEHGLLNLTIE